MRILIRTSKWAIWARRFGSFALPLAVIPVFMHRGRVITSETFEIIEIVAVGVAIMALLLSFGAFIRLWLTGDRGWGRASTGFVLSLICLTPLGVGLIDFLRYPLSGEVSTDTADPPPLLSSVSLVAVAGGDPAQIAAAFPNAKTRRYPFDAVQLYGIVTKLVQERGWEIRLQRAPATGFDDGQINALAMSLFGWRDEVSIRVSGDPEGVSVAMRSASLSAIHDPGINGQRIEEFLVALDTKVSLLMRDEPAGTATADAESDATTPDAASGDSATAPTN